MEKDNYIFDTYALMEIIEGNPKYTPYTNMGIIINNFIFAEFCYVLYREEYPDSDFYTDKYKKYIVSISPETIKKAMKFRKENKKKNLSIIDCIGYFMSKDLGIKFLTGDKEFENLENVEFVKK